MPTAEHLLALHGVGQLSMSFRFDLLDRDETKIGELNPNRDSTPTITHDSSRVVMRDMADLILLPDDYAAVNQLSDRIRPSLILEDGSEFPLGIFLFASASITVASYGRGLVASLVDKGFILDQPNDQTYNVPAGTDVRNAIMKVFAEIDVDVQVDSTSATIGEAVSWPAGTNRSQIVTDLCVVGGYLPPAFDHSGHCRVIRAVDLSITDPEVAYADHGIYANTPIETDDLLIAPNRIKVISSTSTLEGAIVAHYDVPAGSPYSFYARGYRVTEVLNLQGITSYAEAANAARAYVIASLRYEHVEFDGPPNPTHDVFTVVEYLGERWIEQSWTLPLAPSGPMHHRIRKVYT